MYVFVYISINFYFYFIQWIIKRYYDYFFEDQIVPDLASGVSCSCLFFFSFFFFLNHRALNPMCPGRAITNFFTFNYFLFNSIYWSDIG